MAESPFLYASNDSSLFWNTTDECWNNPHGICCQQLLKIARTINNRLWTEYTKSEEHLAGADLYATVIIGLFASIIILLMFRSIRWKETIDDQVTVLLSSMQMRVDQDEVIRRKRNMREAKIRAQLWLAELRSRSLNKISKVHRSSSYTPRQRKRSVASAPLALHTYSLRLASKAKSYNGTLPAIVVQGEAIREDGSNHSRATSRRSSIFSDLQSSCSFDQEVFPLEVQEEV